MRIGVVGRHPLRSKRLAYHGRKAFDRLVAVHRERGDASLGVTRDAVFREDRRDFLGVGNLPELRGLPAIWEVDPKAGTKRLFATGLRNPNGLVWEPQTGVLWTVVNERDELGSDLVPDYLTSVTDGGFYGWPYSYWGQHVDTRGRKAREALDRERH